ncbi:MAG TPA: hypothetical protein VH538_03110 [Gaiellaceae bacterium]|jgi:hypothetical protein
MTRVALLVLVAVAGLATAGGSNAAAVTGGCTSGAPAGYTYAGHRADAVSQGVRATITPLAAPQVAAGHVAAWVGVGGPGDGPGGTDEWLQVGIASLSSGTLFVYAETERNGEQPDVTTLRASVRAGESHRVAIAALGNRSDRWRVWVDGTPAGEPVLLPGSSGRWKPIATAESWSAKRTVCNSFAFRFDQVEVRSSGSWRPFVSEQRFVDRGDVLRAVDHPGAVTFGFVARSR